MDLLFISFWRLAIAKKKEILLQRSKWKSYHKILAEKEFTHEELMIGKFFIFLFISFTVRYHSCKKFKAEFWYRTPVHNTNLMKQVVMHERDRKKKILLGRNRLLEDKKMHNSQKHEEFIIKGIKLKRNIVVYQTKVTKRHI